MARSKMFGASENTPELREPDIDQLVDNPQQPRQHIDENGINELAETIARVGLLEPIVIKALDDDKFMIIAGHRRVLACKQLGWTSIPAVVLTKKAAAASP